MVLAMCAYTAACSSPKIIHQAFFYPVTTTSTETSTSTTYPSGLGFIVPTTHWCNGACFGDKDEALNSGPGLSSARKTNIGSAMLSTPEQLKGLSNTANHCGY
jgi:hypothetical protein